MSGFKTSLKIGGTANVAGIIAIVSNPFTVPNK